MSARISLDALFKEQSKKTNPPESLFVILPLDAKFVMIRRWNPSDRCACGTGFTKVPRGEILSVTKTGKTQYCCGKSLQVVTVEFSKKPTLTYAHVLAATQHSKGARPTRSGVVPYDDTTLPIVLTKDGSSETGMPDGGYTGDPYTDSLLQQQCVTGCLVQAWLLEPNRNKMTPAQVAAWKAEATEQCEQACALYLTDPSSYQ